MRIFSGTSNTTLAARIVKYLGTTLGDAEIKTFPDGETWVKIKENIRGKDVFVIQSICRKPNEYLMELLIMIDAMKRASAERITAVLPFYGYARQDRKDQPRVPITAKLVANLISAAGADRVLTLDLHSHQIQGFFDIPVDHLTAAPVIVKYLKGKRLRRPIIVSPDTGGVKMAYTYCQMLECGLAVVAKQRKSPTEVEAMTLVGDVKGREALLVDDLTTTGGTLKAAAEVLKKHGVKDVYAAVTHAVLTENGIANLRDTAIKELIVTDSVPSISTEGIRLTTLSVDELLGQAIKRIHDNQSVTSLFKV